jgi:hypothetical protein
MKKSSNHTNQKCNRRREAFAVRCAGIERGNQYHEKQEEEEEEEKEEEEEEVEVEAEEIANVGMSGFSLNS